MTPYLSRAIAALSLLVCASAHAVVGWKLNVPVRGVQVHNDGSFVFFAPSGTDSVCLEGGSWFQVKAGQGGVVPEAVKPLLAALLTASTTGKTITFAYDNATNQCFVAHIRLDY